LFGGADSIDEIQEVAVSKPSLHGGRFTEMD